LALTGAAGNCSEAKRRALALADTRSRKCRLGPRLLAIELPDLAELLVLEGLDIAISGTEKLLCLRTPETLAHNRLVAFSSFIGFFAGAYAAVKLGDLTLRNNDSSRARCCRSIYLQTGWPLTTAIVFPGGHPFGCGWTSLGAAGGGTGLAAAAAGAIGFAPAGGVTGLAAGICGDGIAGLAPLPGGGDGKAVTGLVGAVSDDGFADFPAGTCGDGVAGFALPPPGDCMPGVIAAEGVVGNEGFALGGCGSGVAGFALSPGNRLMARPRFSQNAGRPKAQPG
jgi:hypothetical protein